MRRGETGTFWASTLRPLHWAHHKRENQMSAEHKLSRLLASGLLASGMLVGVAGAAMAQDDRPPDVLNPIPGIPALPGDGDSGEDSGEDEDTDGDGDAPSLPIPSPPIPGGGA